MQRALVTGGAGFIGSNLTDRLINEGFQVTVVDDLSNGHLNFLKDAKVKEILTTSFADPKVLDRIRSGAFNVVFHEAAIPRVSYSVEHPVETTEVNVMDSVLLLDACRGHVKRFVFASSSSVYGGADQLPTPNTAPKNPKSPYALQKSVIEEYCSMFSMLYNLDTICLRYFNVFGPRQYGDSPYSTAVSAWCHAIKHNLPLRSDGTGEQSRDMCYVDNVVEANLLAAKATRQFKGERYNIACGDRVTNNQILDYFKKRYPRLEVTTAPWRPGDVMHTQADISATTEAVGYQCKVRFWEGLEKTVAWWGL
jgi:nucleoside-diphosphate-sugar epimerase